MADADVVGADAAAIAAVSGTGAFFVSTAGKISAYVLQSGMSSPSSRHAGHELRPVLNHWSTQSL